MRTCRADECQVSNVYLRHRRIIRRVKRRYIPYIVPARVYV